MLYYSPSQNGIPQTKPSHNYAVRGEFNLQLLLFKLGTLSANTKEGQNTNEEGGPLKIPHQMIIAIVLFIVKSSLSLSLSPFFLPVKVNHGDNPSSLPGLPFYIYIYSRCLALTPRILVWVFLNFLANSQTVFWVFLIIIIIILVSCCESFLVII